MNDNSESVVAAVRLGGSIRWFRGPRELWVMDYKKWRDSYVSSGHDVPHLDDSDRGGIHVVNDASASAFLRFVEGHRVEKDVLARELALRYRNARNWWDVADLFPVVFIDFDHRHLSGFYPNGTPMEKYAPDGWSSAFEDFLTEAPEEIFPTADKFWVREGSDLLALLNARGSGDA